MLIELIDNIKNKIMSNKENEREDSRQPEWILKTGVENF